MNVRRFCWYNQTQDYEWRTATVELANSGTSREVVSSATPAPLADPMTIIMKTLENLQMQVMEQQREISLERRELTRTSYVELLIVFGTI